MRKKLDYLNFQTGSFIKNASKLISRNNTSEIDTLI